MVGMMPSDEEFSLIQRTRNPLNLYVLADGLFYNPKEPGTSRELSLDNRWAIGSIMDQLGIHTTYITSNRVTPFFEALKRNRIPMPNAIAAGNTLYVSKEGGKIVTAPYQGLDKLVAPTSIGVAHPDVQLPLQLDYRIQQSSKPEELIEQLFQRVHYVSQQVNRLPPSYQLLPKFSSAMSSNAFVGNGHSPKG